MFTKEERRQWMIVWKSTRMKATKLFQEDKDNWLTTVILWGQLKKAKKYITFNNIQLVLKAKLMYNYPQLYVFVKFRTKRQHFKYNKSQINIYLSREEKKKNCRYYLFCLTQIIIFNRQIDLTILNLNKLACLHTSKIVRACLCVYTTIHTCWEYFLIYTFMLTLTTLTIGSILDCYLRDRVPSPKTSSGGNFLVAYTSASAIVICEWFWVFSVIITLSRIFKASPGFIAVPPNMFSYNGI